MDSGWQILWTAVAAAGATAGTNLLFGTYLGSKVKGSIDNAFAKEKELREASLGNRIYITQARFDVEIKAVRELSEAFADMFVALTKVAPPIAVRQQDFSREQVRAEYARRIAHLDDKIGMLGIRCVALRAFVPERQYDLLSHALNIASEGSLFLKPLTTVSVNRKWLRFAMYLSKT